jgi:hypothetical protein
MGSQTWELLEQMLDDESVPQPEEQTKTKQGESLSSHPDCAPLGVFADTKYPRQRNIPSAWLNQEGIKHNSLTTVMMKSTLTLMKALIWIHQPEKRKNTLPFSQMDR